MPDRWRPAREWEPPPDAVIDVWRFDLQVSKNDWAILAPEEAKTVRRIVVDEKRDRKASARAYLRRILALYVETPPEDIEFAYGDRGKPRLADHDEPQFNLSDSELMGIAAVTRGIRIGADIEFSRDGRSFTGIADRFFAKTESTALRALPPEEQRAAFYRAWTRKEAYLKAWGTGLSFGSNRFTLEFAADGPGRLLTTEMPGDDASRWRFKDVDLDPAYTAAICFEGPDRPMRCWSI